MNREKIKQIVSEAFDLESSQRVAFVRKACGDDIPLLNEVLSLLDAASSAQQAGFLPSNRVAGPPVSTMVDDRNRSDSDLPQRISRYRILERLGGGGMGEVYVAEQTEPIKRRVAVKVIKAGMDTKQVVARFEAERQALAMMDHPNIAKVFDAGSTETGQPYFVMELVRGIPITKFCDDNKITTRQRVELLVPICQAVQHAHQKGIIHRDIKPHNVLVTLHDGKPVPKVIDFGIAKATSQPLTDKTIYTEFRAMIGTPAYMSPEQAEMSGLDIDTRSDIYSLGVLAYELLTGSPPFENERLAKAGLAEIQRIIKEEDPPRPSIRLSTIGDRLTTVAKSRDVEPSKLSKLLAGELDWIIMRAMEKDRKRRYDTATDLAADFSRHLNGEPVVAAPPTWAYRTRKFVRKHRGPVIAAAAVLAVLSLGLGGTTWEAFRVAKERNRAEDANKHLREDQETSIETLGQIVPPDPGISRRKIAEAMIAGAKSVAHDTKLGWEGPNGIGRPEISEVGFLALIAKQNYRWLQEKTDAAELEAYTADLALAQSAMASGNWPEARARLDACPQSKRGWEWTFLRKQAAEWQCALPGEVCGFGDEGKLSLVNLSKGKIQLRDTESGDACGEPLQGVPAEGLDSYFCKPSPNGSLVVGAFRDKSKAKDLNKLGWSTANTLRIWDAKTGQILNTAIAPEGVLGIKFSSDNKHFATWYSDPARRNEANDMFTLQVWAAPTCTRVGEEILLPAGFEDVEFTPDGNRVLGICRRGVKICDILTGKVLGNFSPGDLFTGYGNALEFSPDGATILTRSYGVVQLWDRFSGKVIRRLPDTPAPIKSAIFSTDGSRLLTTDVDGSVRLINPLTDKIDWEQTIPEIAAESENTFSVRSSRTRDGFAVAVTFYRSTSDGDVVRCGFLELLDQNGSKLSGVATSSSPDHNGSQIFSSGNSILNPNQPDDAVDTFNDGDVALEVQALTAESTSDAKFDGVQSERRHNATLENGFLEFTNSTSGGKPLRIVTQHSPIRAFAFSPDGTRLVTGDDTSIRFYGDNDWNELAIFRNDSPVTQLQFTPDGTRLIVWFADDSAQVWDPRPLSERQKMWARRSAEQSPAREYITKLLAGPTPIDAIRPMVRNDTTLTPLRKLASVQYLDTQIADIKNEVNSRFEKLDDRCWLYEQLEASAAAISNSRVREGLMAKIREWKPEPAKINRMVLDIVLDKTLGMGAYKKANAIARHSILLAEDARSLNALGESQYRLGNYDDAIKTLLRANAMWTNGDWPSIAYNWSFIAMAYSRQGKVAEARDALTKALAGPDDKWRVKDIQAEATALIGAATTQPRESK